MKIKRKTSRSGRYRRPNSTGTLRPGFTLVELLTVIAIIAILMSILIPVLAKAKILGMRAKCASNLRQIYIAMDLYTNGNDSIYPCAEDPVSASPYYWLWMGRGFRGFIEPYLGGYIDSDNPSVLLCPQDRTSIENYESTSYAYSMAFYHSPEQIDDMNDFSDCYLGARPSVPQRSVNVASPSGKILAGEWLSNHFQIDKDKEIGWWCWEGRRNYLFADGHVVYLMASQIRSANDGNPNANLTQKGIRGRDLPP